MKWEAFKPFFEQGWQRYMKDFIESKECDQIYGFLKARRNVATITPSSKDTWRAFSLCKWYDLKVVLIGQDPYPQKGIADGLAFSVNKEVSMDLQPSLEIMLNAIEEDCYGGMNLFMSILPSLEEWAMEGVLLLNYALTTEVGNPGAHKDLWLDFHKYLINILNKEKDNLVFILLGSKAGKLEPLIDKEKHLVLKAEHPAKAHHENRKMAHNSVFSEANKYLENYNLGPVDWARTLPF